MKNDDILKQENGEALIILKKIEKIRKRTHKLVAEINSLNSQLKSVCLHNDIETVQNYISGGYLDREEYITTVKCKICGEILSTETKLGGFG
jgi:hypothetical protein